ncbi:DUF6461 domain-containing protein [Williamsia sp. D3]|uniref:DUF6461 domain-containing protein n=1 Tax=Williamsia sp. D3 TaxID=1313067 RepID=UPI000423AC6F|nr:DUF6461 domain-containing protein [Williamsia sp. D3]
MGNVTYRDYAWTKKAPDLFYGFCLTFIRHATVPDVINALPTVGQPERATSHAPVAVARVVGGDR